ncbi:fumarylacetoacetase [Herbaspirillum sp. YR522]|uniref:fumarylacetoacetase n=1 Tax=Herbaspirillum sp. YR522 TaxID=1144342 RepID=UPI00026F6D60|nr:fumarylacetoacetase [Herbaspirillum sp. YR522]EJN09966.1 fumarylacetoacetase [Herbaspirillum sp. YR522]
MSIALNETHDIDLRSWVDSANGQDHPFPIQNLPYGVFRHAGSDQPWRVGVAIGDAILDLRAAQAAGVFSGFDESTRQAAQLAAQGSSLNPLMAAAPAAWSALRLALSRLLRSDSSHRHELQACLLPQAQAEHGLPAVIGDYTDFYTSIHHATTIGKLFRPDNPLLPNYKWVPIGYHGRASSIGVSGQQLRRPLGQTKAADADTPSFGPCKRLDYELEVGIFIGGENALGEAVPMAQAEQRVFGLCLLNDWSARDVQAWEYQPLGPFLSKSFASTISPWVVTLEALAPYRCGWTRAVEDPQPLAYLDSPGLREHGAIDLQLEVLIQTAAMRQAGLPAQRLSLSNFRDAYWSVAQLVAHHTVNGCNLRAGDLFGSGTLSGPQPEQAGSLLELSRGGKQAVQLSNGEQRIFVEDGDTIIMRAVAQRPGLPRIGLGEVAGSVLPARQWR